MGSFAYDGLQRHLPIGREQTVNHQQQNTFIPELHDPSGERLKKTDQLGITMLIDKGISVKWFEEFLEQSRKFVHYIKLGFGTTMLYPPEILQKKLQIAKNAGIILYPGGTLFEIACHQGVLRDLFNYLKKIGFHHLEISDGTIELPAAMRKKLIKEAIHEGFAVITEFGKKAVGSRFEVDELKRTLYSDLESGASYVIVEGRESGKDVGIYDENGSIDLNFLHKIEQMIPEEMRNYLIWEAPKKNQQIALIHFWGRNVNMGNIQFEDAFNLECLRRGLRFDTFPLKPSENILQVNEM